MGIHAVHSSRVALLYFGSGALIVAVSLIEHAHAMAYMDALTELPNRRALDEFLPQLHKRFALAMVDVDHFKTFNDKHGHDAGDQVLRKVAVHLASVSGGRAFRYGGEEFSIVFPGRSCREAQPHLEALRARIEDSRLPPARPVASQAKAPGAPRSAARRCESFTSRLASGRPRWARNLIHRGRSSKRPTGRCRAKEEGRNQVWFHS